MVINAHMPRTLASALVAAVAAAATGFVIHVGTQAWVKSWVSERMQGKEVAASWDVRHLALITSLETGVGLVILYALVRRAMPVRSAVLRGLLLGVVLLAVMGRLIRQPVMNPAIGNPLAVVVVQDGVSWVLWPAAAAVAAVVFERLSPESAG